MRSKNHQIVVNRLHKVAMSIYDDKRYLLDDAVKSLAYGQCKIGKKSDEQDYH